MISIEFHCRQNLSNGESYPSDCANLFLSSLDVQYFQFIIISNYFIICDVLYRSPYSSNTRKRKSSISQLFKYFISIDI